MRIASFRSWSSLAAFVGGCGDDRRRRAAPASTPATWLGGGGGGRRAGGRPAARRRQRPGAPGPATITRDGGGTGSLGDGGVFDAAAARDHAAPSRARAAGHAHRRGHVLGAGTDFRDVSTDKGDGVWAVTPTHRLLLPRRRRRRPTTRRTGWRRARRPGSTTTGAWATACPARTRAGHVHVGGGRTAGPGGDRQHRLHRRSAQRRSVDGRGAERRRPAGDLDAAAATDRARRAAAARGRVVEGRRSTSTARSAAPRTSAAGTASARFHGLTHRARPASAEGCGDFEEHVHGFFNGGTQPAGRDVHALAITPEGDLWMGDADVISFMPQRSLGPNADFFQTRRHPGPAGRVDARRLPRRERQHLRPRRSTRRAASTSRRTATASPIWRRAATRRPIGRRADKLPQNYLTGVAVDDSRRRLDRRRRRRASCAISRRRRRGSTTRPRRGCRRTTSARSTSTSTRRRGAPSTSPPTTASPSTPVRKLGRGGAKILRITLGHRRHLGTVEHAARAQAAVAFGQAIMRYRRIEMMLDVIMHVVRKQDPVQVERARSWCARP